MLIFRSLFTQEVSARPALLISCISSANQWPFLLAEQQHISSKLMHIFNCDRHSNTQEYDIIGWNVTCAAVKWGEYAFSTYWAWGCPPLRCTRRTPDPWTAAAAPWSCSAGNPSASHIRPAPWSSPRRTPPTGHAQKADRNKREWLNS